jgi:predicted nucleic acid-binding protein
MDDIAFVALSLFLDIKLWTGDKQLIGGLTKKGFKNIITTHEMLQLRR